MVRNARVCLDEELEWNAAETREEGVAVQNQTAVLLKLHAEDDSADITSTELEETDQPKPAQPEKKPAHERRHLAGANWLDDWTQYFPVQKQPGRKKRRSE